MTIMTEARLYRVNFHGAMLREADLTGAFLQGARLENADLRGAMLDGANMDNVTICPDGASWSPDTDMRRFTDPAHPEFWTPPVIEGNRAGERNGEHNL